MHKLSEKSNYLENFIIKIINEDSVSREIKREIGLTFISNQNAEKDYLIELKIDENLFPLIINSDGTVSKYRIELSINYSVINLKDNSSLMSDVVRGFAQYTVETSEIESDDKKKRMIRTATSSAIQMMISKIQSDTSITNDN
tara:strand:+ start:116 stop:544 length:429 start_codon:yes stop_codon:yes gene_type:complete